MTSTFDDVVSAFKKLLHFDDADAIRVLLAAIIANAFPTDPVWIFLVAPSASSKSELVNALASIPSTLMLSSVTPQTFLSGMKGRDGKDLSLLNDKSRIKDGTVLLLKDFTTILNLRQENKMEIMAQLREIFDGKISKIFGTGDERKWEGKIGFIAGVTYEIEDALMVNSKFGDRFLYYKLNSIDTRLAMRKVRSVIGQESFLRTDIAAVTRDFYASTVGESFPDIGPLPDRIATALEELCALAVLARGTVLRDQYGGKDIIRVMHPESPMRMYKELMTLGQGLMVLRGAVWSDEDYPLLAKVAFDAAPSWRVEALSLLAGSSAVLTTDEIGGKLGKPSRTTRIILEDLECHGLVSRNVDTREQGEAYEWALTAEARRMMGYLKTPSPQDIVL